MRLRGVYCGGLRGEGDLFCGLEQVLSDRGHRQLGVGFGLPEIAGAVEAEEAFHHAKALLDPKPAFGDELVEPLLRCP